MKPSTLDMLRAYLMTASLAATLIIVLVLLSHVLLGIAEITFQSTIFRLSAGATIICLVLATKFTARRAFETALVSRQILFDDSGSGGVGLARECRKRELVILHLRLSRKLDGPIID
jgi:hypothetical protein